MNYEKLHGDHVAAVGRVLDVCLCYPDCDNNINTVDVGLIDVRAADDIRITYDKERDGWSISQASTFEWPVDDEECDPDWQEVAFIPAWARQENPNFKLTEEKKHE